ncbi:MAG: prepilin-type N-terminal cleavage/methylation domain-containing protein [Candidatus Desantisbacteria bacterium]
MKKQEIESGFTLLEVMVAVSIFGIAVIALLGVFSNGLNLIRATKDQTQAIILAQSKLAEFNAGLEKNTQGEEKALTWEIQTSARGQGMEQIDISVSKNGNKKMQITGLRQVETNQVFRLKAVRL